MNLKRIYRSGLRALWAAMDPLAGGERARARLTEGEPTPEAARELAEHLRMHSATLQRCANELERAAARSDGPHLFEDRVS